MVSDSILVVRLHELLRNSDLNTTTTATLRRRLEQELGIDLSDKKVFVREQVDLFLQCQFEKTEAEENDERRRQQYDEEDQKDKVKLEESEEGSGSKDGDDDDDGDDEDEEESNQKSATKKRGSNVEIKEIKKRGGFSKLCSLSPQLQNFVGVSEMARTEVVKQLWAYIREKNLQDPNNRRDILCDKLLRTIFEVDSINMFQMNKALTKHIWPLEAEGGSTMSTPKEKQRKQEREDADDEPKPKEKRQKVGNSSGLNAPLPLSDALVKFLGTGECILSRVDVVKRMWEYIKRNNLQDPSDKRRIICDEKLKELFDIDSFNGFTVQKLLTTHFIKDRSVS